MLLLVPPELLPEEPGFENHPELPLELLPELLPPEELFGGVLKLPDLKPPPEDFEELELLLELPGMDFGVLKLPDLKLPPEDFELLKPPEDLKPPELMPPVLPPAA